jgi:hypothetical protein
MLFNVQLTRGLGQKSLTTAAINPGAWLILGQICKMFADRSFQGPFRDDQRKHDRTALPPSFACDIRDIVDAHSVCRLLCTDVRLFQLHPFVAD